MQTASIQFRLDNKSHTVLLVLHSHTYIHTLCSPLAAHIFSSYCNKLPVFILTKVNFTKSELRIDVKIEVIKRLHVQTMVTSFKWLFVPECCCKCLIIFHSKRSSVGLMQKCHSSLILHQISWCCFRQTYASISWQPSQMLNCGTFSMKEERERESVCEREKTIKKKQSILWHKSRWIAQRLFRNALNLKVMNCIFSNKTSPNIYTGPWSRNYCAYVLFEFQEERSRNIKPKNLFASTEKKNREPATSTKCATCTTHPYTHMHYTHTYKYKIMFNEE